MKKDTLQQYPIFTDVIDGRDICMHCLLFIGGIRKDVLY